MPTWILLAATVVELVLLVMVFAFFQRLKRSESLVQSLQENQETLLRKLQFNAQLEQELVSTFAQRQQELAGLTRQLEDRAEELRELLRTAERIARSPDTLRQMVVQGHRRGQSPRALAHATGLSLDEVELIVRQARQALQQQRDGDR